MNSAKERRSKKPKDDRFERIIKSVLMETLICLELFSEAQGSRTGPAPRKREGGKHRGDGESPTHPSASQGPPERQKKRNERRKEMKGFAGGYDGEEARRNRGPKKLDLTRR